MQILRELEGLRWTNSVARMDWHLDPGSGPTQHSQTVDSGHDCAARLWSQETRAWTADAAALASETAPDCDGGSAYEAG